MNQQPAIKPSATSTAPMGPGLQRRHRLCLGLLITTLMAATVWGGNAQRVAVPPGPLPFYAAGLGNTGTGPNDWVVAAFYFPPEDIIADGQGDFDLFSQPVWEAPVGVETPLVEGFSVWGAKIPYYPIQQVLQNVPGKRVPIWFVPVKNFIAHVDASGNYIWTVNSMKAEGAIVGWADFYRENTEPATTGSHQTYLASGVMEDGRSFWVKSTMSIARWNGHAMSPGCLVHFGK
jgi:hypothetical protein